MESYHVLEMIGEGSFGRVYKGRKKFSGQVVALKFIPKVGRSEKELRSLRREIEIMRGLRHPNVVLLLDSFETDREVVVVTEYAEGELFQILEDDGVLPESQVKVIACQLVSALYYLHSHRILHRDMKPQNILLGKGGVVKLCDFGFARAMSVSTLVLTSIKGTPLYMSPELVAEKPYDHTADLWSLGCILYELHTGAPPFYTNSIFQLVQLIVRDPVKWPESMSQACKSFLQGLLTKDPQKRLSWPELLEHPFVADGVLVLPEEGALNPLTVTPSADLQALKLQQVKEREKTAPSSGEGKLLRKAREQRDKEKKSKGDVSGKVQMKGDKGDKAPLRAALDRKPLSKDYQVSASHRLGQDPAQASNAWLAQSDQTVQGPEDGCVDGQISRDYAKQFPSVEVGPRRVVTIQHGSQAGQGREHLTSEEMGSDEEWQQMVRTADAGDGISETFDQSILPHLRDRLLTSKVQLTDGNVEGACRIHQPLRVLCSLLRPDADPEVIRHVAKEVDLPYFLFDLTDNIMKRPVIQQQSWCVSVLGDTLSALLAYWDKHWEPVEKRFEERTDSFMTILLRPDLAPLAPLAAAVLALFTRHGAPPELFLDRLVPVMERLLSEPTQRCIPLPRGWGLFDGFLPLLFHTLSEQLGGAPPSEFLNSTLWRLLWLRVNTALIEDNMDFLSLSGAHAFLSLVLFVFTREPLGCVPIFADSGSGCVEALGHLLSVESDRMKNWPAEGRPAHPWISPSSSSLSVLSCHLLCFPFAVEVPDETMVEILRSYHSCDIVLRLSQLSLALPLALLEIPLSLLCRLLLCDPQRSVPRFMAATDVHGLFRASPGLEVHDGRNAGSPVCGGQGEASLRTASSLLGAFLKSEAFSSSAAALLSLLSQAARWSLRPPFSLLYVDPSLLKLSLAHPDHSVRAAACSFLGNLDPVAGNSLPVRKLLLSLLQDLSSQFHDQSLTVRRTACRAVGTWLGLIGSACGCDERQVDSPGEEFPVQGTDGWAQVALETAPTLSALLWDPDPLVRRHCCSALGNLATLQGGPASLLQCDGPARLLHVACTDPRRDVCQAALCSLHVFSLQDSLRQTLVSLDASEKLRCVSQNSPPLRLYSRLVSRLRPT